jgi:hypothetical protein
VPLDAVEGYHSTEILQMPGHLHTSGHPRVGGPEQHGSMSVVGFVEGPCSTDMTLQMRSSHLSKGITRPRFHTTSQTLARSSAIGTTESTCGERIDTYAIEGGRSTETAAGTRNSAPWQRPSPSEVRELARQVANVEQRHLSFPS